MKRFIYLILFTSLTLVSQAQDLKKVEKYIEQARIKYNVPGMSVGIVKDGEVWLSKGFGTLEKGKSTKVDGNSLFAIASNTKAFISSALALLVQEGKLDWDDKVKTHLPYFELYDPYVTHEITIRDLLCHRSGLGTFSGDAIWYKSELPAEEIVKLVKNVPPAFGFRNGYGYSNLMFITAGEVITKIAGIPWQQYLEENFFRPLQMDRTITSVKRLDEKGNFAIPHKTQLDKNQAIDWTNWDNMGAAGGIISSSSDMAKWMIMQLEIANESKEYTLTTEQQNILWTAHNNFVLTTRSKKSIPGRHFSGYGLGWSLQDYHGRLMASHGGGYDGMYSRVAMIPDEGIGIVILTNSMSGISTPLSYYLINQFLQEDKRDWVNEWYRPQSADSRIEALKSAKIANTSPTLDLSTYSGEYQATMYGTIQVKKQGDNLRLEFSHSPLLSASLRHWHNDTFEIIWDKTHAWFDFGLVTFRLDEKLDVQGFSFNVPNYDIFFDEFEVNKK